MSCHICRQASRRVAPALKRVSSGGPRWAPKTRKRQWESEANETRIVPAAFLGAAMLRNCSSFRWQLTKRAGLGVIRYSRRSRELRQANSFPGLPHPCPEGKPSHCGRAGNRHGHKGSSFGSSTNEWQTTSLAAGVPAGELYQTAPALMVAYFRKVGGKRSDCWLSLCWCTIVMPSAGLHRIVPWQEGPLEGELLVH